MCYLRFQDSRKNLRYFTQLWIVGGSLNVNIEVRIRDNAQLGFGTLVPVRYFWRPKLRQLGVS